HNARLVLMEGSVPTAIFGLGCLGSLGARRPLMFSFALEFAGPGSATGQEMTRLWQHEGYRRVFRTITIGWGVGFLAQAVFRTGGVAETSTGTGLAISKVTPYIVFGVLSVWTVAYGQYHKRKGERQAAAAGEVTDAGDASAPAPEAPAAPVAPAAERT